MITKKQIMLLRTLASGQFPADDLYHAWLEQQFGVASTKDLTVGMAKRAIWLLFPEYQRGKRPGRFPTGSGYATHLTQKQAGKIGGLASELRWGKQSLVDFIRRQTGQSKAVEMLSVKEAGKVIIGMERVLAYNNRSRNEH